MVNGVHILPATPKNAHLQNDLIQKLVLQYLGIQISNMTLYEDSLYFCHAYSCDKITMAQIQIYRQN